ncbi:MAG: hypothetical protein RLZZ592_2727 [Pseudomonadota bacterium]
MDDHVNRLDRLLVLLLTSRSTAALATLDDAGLPAVSMVPYAVEAGGPDLLILVSGLAAHTRQLRAQPRASVLVCASEDQADTVHALPRVTLTVEARWPEPGSEAARQGLQTYLARHPSAGMLTELPDFALARLRLLEARQIAGFGAARTVDGTRLGQLLRQTLD